MTEGTLELAALGGEQRAGAFGVHQCSPAPASTP
jgi:hypothetical protein